MKTESCEGSPRLPRPPWLPGCLGEGWGSGKGGGRRSEGPFPLAQGCPDPDLAKDGAASGTRPEAALASLECRRAGGTSSRYPPGPLMHLDTSAVPGSGPTGVSRGLATSASVLLCMSAHVCFCVSACTPTGSACVRLFPQVLVTAGAPPHAHGGFYFCTCLFLHVSLCGALAVHRSRCLRSATR